MKSIRNLVLSFICLTALLIPQPAHALSIAEQLVGLGMPSELANYLAGAISTITNAVGITFTGTSNVATLKMDTADAADTKEIKITGGGAYGNTRGAGLTLAGNEKTTDLGLVELTTGDVTGAKLTLKAPNATGAVDISLAGTVKWTFDVAGGGLLYKTAAGGFIAASTADAADNSQLDVSGGGGTAMDSTRGAGASWHGNEDTSSEGLLDITTGASASANGIMRFSLGSSGQLFRFRDAAALALLDLDTTVGAKFSKDVIMAVAGNGLQIKEGSNARMGRAVCNGTTEVTVSTTQALTGSEIFLTENVVGGSPLGVVYVSSRSNGVSFGFKCAATDTSTVAWMIVNPAA